MESARSAFMQNKISDAFENNKYFWKKTRKLRLLPTTDGPLHGFSPDELNTHFSYISVLLLEDPTESYNVISTASPDGFDGTM